MAKAPFTFSVTKEGNQIGRLSPDFRDSLRQAIDAFAAKKQQKQAQVAGLPADGDKAGSASDALNKTMQFCQHHVNDWLLSLDEGSLQEFNRLMEQVNGVSAAEFSGGASPFEALAAMMTSGCQSDEPEIVVEEEVAVPPVSPDGAPQTPKQVTHEERIPLEGMTPGMSK